MERSPVAPVRLNPDVPAELERIINKALEKDRDIRCQSAAELRADLKRLKRDTESTRVTAAGVAASPVRQKRNLWFGIGAFTVLAAAIAWGIYGYLIPQPAPFQKIEISQLTSTGKVKLAAISPDGKYVAYVVDEEGEYVGGQSRESVWVRQVAGSDVRVAEPALVSYHALTFSHDGDFLYAVRAEGKDTAFAYLYKIPVLGGTAKKLSTDVDSKVSLSQDGKQIAFVRNSSTNNDSSLMIANADGTGEKKIAVHKYPRSFGSPAWSPRGDTLAAIVYNSESGRQYATLAEILVQGGVERPISSKQWDWLGSLAWVSDGRGLIAIARERINDHQQIEYISFANGEVRRITNDLNDYLAVTLTADSRVLATAPIKFSSDVWVGSLAEPEGAKPITSGGFSGGPVWGPNGQIIYGKFSGDHVDWIVMNQDGSNPKQLLADAGSIGGLRVSIQSRHLVFVSTRTGSTHLWRADLDGNNPVQLTNSPWDRWEGRDFSHDGKWVYYSKGGPERGIWKVSIDGGEPVKVLATNDWAAFPVVSPDGKMLAYSYREDGAHHGGRDRLVGRRRHAETF